ncbi:tetratricopeptide repeat protein [Gracilimonas sp.]|uniref:tetratricopeptide repeat protein n=1 Tax=Gracilimonas sp. TaxID=1974203 RepID=UPI003BA8F41D
MSDYNWQTVETIIDEVLALPVENREEYIRERCEGNEELKDEVTLLLASITESEGWLENPGEYKRELFDELSEDFSALSAQQPLIGSKIGAYIIKEEIGFGGMGKVFRAERDEDHLTHHVAIKVLNKHRASATIIERFKREQQVLAKLNHPHIARFFDGGVTADGSPYIIMEYVRGIPIDEYCRDNGCSVPQKISLFKDVLKGVRYAHENLVIHRDLKPANILVTENGKVKILDFGISKLMDEELDTELTMEGARLLTPKFAAPEQIMEHNITTATDTYSLGVLLYHLITSTFPYNLKNLSQYEAEQVILKSDPQKPSETVDNPLLKKQLSGDLDAILLKAIRKEADYRYRTANDFLDDLLSFEKNLPVSAHEDSRSYRFKKFIKRNKKNVSFASLLFFVVITLIGFYTLRITEERNQANIEAEKAEQITGFMIDLFSASDPYEAQGDTIPVRTVLNKGFEKLDNLNNQPLLKSAIQGTIGKVFLNLGDYNEAENLLLQSLTLEKEHGEDEAKLATLHNDLGVLYHRQEQIDKAKPHYLQAIEIKKKVLGINNLDYAQSLSDYGALMRISNNLDSAKILYKEALEIRQRNLPEDHPDITTILNNIAVIYNKEGKLDESEKYYKKALNIRVSNFGETHPKVANTLNNLAVLYRRKGDFDQAAYYYQKTLRIRKDLFGNDHPEVAQSINNYAGFLKEKGDLEKAEDLYVEALDIRRELFGENHIKTGTSYNNLANIYLLKNKLEEAESMYRKAIDIYGNVLGEDHLYVGIVLSNLGRTNTLKNNFESAAAILNRSYEILTASSSRPTLSISNVLFYKGNLALQQQDIGKATNHHEEALAIRFNLLGENHPEVRESMETLHELYQKQDQLLKLDSLQKHTSIYLKL